MRKTILAVAIAVLSASAFAVQGNDNPGNPGNNGNGGPPTTNPGNGGDANQGQGQGQLQGQAQGQAQGQLQGQLQGQGQAQGQASFNRNTNLNANANSNRNSNRNTNLNANSARSSANSLGVGMGFSSSYSGGNTQANAQTANQSVTVTDSGRMNYSGSYDVKTVGIAPDVLANPTAPCRVAVGVSGGWLGGALGIGGSVEDTGCTRRENARVLAGLGKGDSAVRLMCKDPEVAQVLDECAAPVTTSVPSYSAPASAAAAPAPAVAFNNPRTVKELNGFNH